MEENLPANVEAVVDQTEPTDDIGETAWVSPAILAAQQGVRVDFSMNIDPTLSEVEKEA